MRFFALILRLLGKLVAFYPFVLFGGLLLVGGIFRLFWRFFASSDAKTV